MFFFKISILTILNMIRFRRFSIWIIDNTLIRNLTSAFKLWWFIYSKVKLNIFRLTSTCQRSRLIRTPLSNWLIWIISFQRRILFRFVFNFIGIFLNCFTYVFVFIIRFVKAKFEFFYVNIGIVHFLFFNWFFYIILYFY